MHEPRTSSFATLVSPWRMSLPILMACVLHVTTGRGEPPRPPFPADEPSVSVHDDGKRLIVKVSGSDVLHYRYREVPSPHADESDYARSGYLDPIFTPDGRKVTDGMPARHTHQHAAMFAWVNTSYEGRDIDFWNSHRSRGRVVHHSIDKITQGAEGGGFVATLRHIEQQEEGRAREILTETWEVRVLPRTHPFVFDLVSTQQAIAQPLTINEYHYGGMSIRGSAEWDGAGRCHFLTSLGDDRETGNHTRPNWVAMYGDVEGRPATIAAFGHPGNFRAPQTVRLHPSLPYFCFAPMVMGEFTITKDRPYVSRYRFVTSDKGPDRATLDQLWQQWTGPPRAE